jgi:hypothetical protein
MDCPECLQGKHDNCDNTTHVALAAEQRPTCLDDPAAPCRYDEGAHGPRVIHDHPAEVSR